MTVSYENATSLKRKHRSKISQCTTRHFFNHQSLSNQCCKETKSSNKCYKGPKLSNQGCKGSKLSNQHSQSLERKHRPTKITLKFALFSVQTVGLKSLTIKTKCKTGHLHNAARARSNTKWCRRGYESTSGLHGMELHAVGLSWDALCRRNQMGRCSKAWKKWEHYTDFRSLQCGTSADLRIVAHTVAV